MKCICPLQVLVLQSGFHRQKKKWLSVWALRDGSYHCGAHFPTPDRFHLVVVWRGSSGLGKIREFIRAPFPPGLGASRVPLREWSASTSGSPRAFDLYNLTITHWENCLESERVGLVTRRVLGECQVNGSSAAALCDRWRRHWFVLLQRTPHCAGLEIPKANPKSRSGGLAVSGHIAKSICKNSARHPLQPIHGKIKQTCATLINLHFKDDQHIS